MTRRRRPAPVTAADVLVFLVVTGALFLLTCGTVFALLVWWTDIRADAALVAGVLAGCYLARARFRTPHLRSPLRNPFVWRRRGGH